ncbi:beta-lactamase/transpeptidase-like protein [Glonium stellatum]|uniref:Beta-lactamase/transpeptidase-like protein n=1 Tax=Glonium stellatum TaxID=574774 RepID=A0A8E2FDE2_9PEZI|nr:beta-lactamase/transpeptidase-like protein [Glonium stellatum]
MADSTEFHYAGLWSGTDSDDPFGHYTELEIFKDEGYVMRLHDRKYAELPEARLVWQSNTAFQAIFPHWIISQPMIIMGVFHQDKALSLGIYGNGMTGLENWTVELKKDNFSTIAYRQPRDHLSYTYHTPCVKQDDRFYEASPAANQGICPDLLERTMSSLIESCSGSHSSPAIPRLEGLLILKNGKLIFEEYLWGMAKDSQHLISSCTKSLVAILTCILVDKGMASLDDVVSDYFDTTTNWSQEEPIRLRHMLAMASGTQPPDKYVILETTSIESTVFGLPRTSSPGSKYIYDNGLPMILGCFIQARSGLSVETFARKYLFEPLNITNYRWTRMRQKAADGTHDVLTSGGFYMTLRDMSKIGQLMLDQGVYGGSRILSTESAKLSVQQQTPKGQYPYGFFWHLSTEDYRHFPNIDGFMALGQGQQLIAVFPPADLVVAAVSSSWVLGPNGSLDWKLMEILGNTLIKGLSS